MAFSKAAVIGQLEKRWDFLSARTVFAEWAKGSGADGDLSPEQVGQLADWVLSLDERTDKVAEALRTFAAGNGGGGGAAAAKPAKKASKKDEAPAKEEKKDDKKDDKKKDDKKDDKKKSSKKSSKKSKKSD